MTSLTVLANSFHKINKNKDTSNLSCTKNNSKDEFFQIFQTEINKENNKITNDELNTKTFKDEIRKENKVDGQNKDQRCKLSDGTEDETILLFNSIVELLLNLSSMLEEFDEIDIESLNIDIKQLSASIKELVNSKELPFVHEEHKNILEIYEKVDSLILAIEKELDINKEWDNKKNVELKSELNELKQLLDSTRVIDNEKLQNINENVSIVEEEDDVLIGSNEVQNRKINLNSNEVFINEDSIQTNKMEVDTEDVVEIVNESNVNDVEPELLALKLESKITLKPNFGIKGENVPDIDTKILFEQIVEKAKLIVEDYRQEIKIKLKPEILGELVLKMEVEKGMLAAKILVDNYRTKELLEANLYQFKEEMKDNGLEIKTFEVFVGSNEDFNRENRREFYLNKKPSKFKVKNNGYNEIKTYEESSTRTAQKNYHEGKLNLFA